MAWTVYYDAEPREATGTLALDDGHTTYQTTGQGHLEFRLDAPAVAGHGATLTTSAPGYATDVRRVTIVSHGALTSGVTLRATAPTRSLPAPWLGSTDFRLLEMLSRGDHGGVRRLLDQRYIVGANLVRVLPMKFNNTGWQLDPRAGLEKVDELADLLYRDYGMYMQLTVFADTALILPNQADQQGYWSRAIEIGQRHSNLLLDLVNEAGHSTQRLDPSLFARPSGVLASHGSRGTDASPVKPLWDYTTFHARRDRPPDARGITNCNPYEFEADYPKPCRFMVEEMMKPEDYGFQQDVAYLMGRHAGIGWGGTFHTNEGINGQMWPNAVEDCARAFYRGVRGQ